MGTFGDYMDDNYIQVVETFKIGDLIRNRHLPAKTFMINSIETKHFPNVEDPEIYFMANPVEIDHHGNLHFLLPVKVSSVSSRRITREDLVNDIVELTIQHEKHVNAIKQLMENVRA